MNRGICYGLEISVKYRYYSQENIVQLLTKTLETVKNYYNEFRMFEIKNIKKTFDKPFFISSSLAAKLTSKLFIVLANWREKKAK